MEDNISFGEYIDQVETILEETYGIDIMDARIEFDDLANCQDNSWTPQEYVNWFGEKYNLIKRTDLDWK